MCYKQKCKVVSLNLAHPVDSRIESGRRYLELLVALELWSSDRHVGLHNS